jgi:hypothetical protein
MTAIADIDHAVARLVAEVYEVAPVSERRRLLDQLLPFLGVLGLVAVANGIFARIRLRGDGMNAPIRVEDLAQVRPSDVADLVERLQLMRVDAVDKLAHWVISSPVLAGSAAAAMLVTLLVQRASTRRGLVAGDSEEDV